MGKVKKKLTVLKNCHLGIKINTEFYHVLLPLCSIIIISEMDWKMYFRNGLVLDGEQ